VSIPGSRKNKRPGIFGKKTESLVENHPSKDGVDKAELMDKKCKKCGELSKEEKCAKCGEMSLPMNKSAIIYSPDGKLDIQGKAKGAVLPEDKKIKEIDTSDVGEVKKGSVKDLRGKAMKKNEPKHPKELDSMKINPDRSGRMNSNRTITPVLEGKDALDFKQKMGVCLEPGCSKIASHEGVHKTELNKAEKEEVRDCAHCGKTVAAKKGHSCPEQTKWIADNKAATAAGKKGVPVPPDMRSATQKAELNRAESKPKFKAGAKVVSLHNQNDYPGVGTVSSSFEEGSDKFHTVEWKHPKHGDRQGVHHEDDIAPATQKAEPPMAKPPSGKNMGTAVPASKPAAPKMPKMAAPNMGKGDFGMTDSGKANTLPQAAAPALPKPKYTAEDLKAGKAALSAAKPGIFGKLQNKKQ
jgi:hypothetical protein